MSRTYKDQPWEYRFPEDQRDYRYFPITDWRCTALAKPGVLTKKRRELDTKYHWMSTPSAWTRIMMNRPQRRGIKLWEREVSKTPVEDADLLVCPYHGRKPHIYYW